MRFRDLLCVSVLMVCRGSTAAPATAAAPVAAPAVAPAGPGTVSAVIEGDPPHFVVRVAHGGSTTSVVDIAAPVEQYDEVKAVTRVVDRSHGRVVLAQKFREVGDDEFSRDIQAWLIDAVHDKVLWTGTGVYSNSFGECESFDVPEAIVEGNQLVVRALRGTARLVKRSKRCGPGKRKTTVEARIPL